MRKLLNTLYVTTPEAYLSKDGLNVVVSVKQEEVFRIPAINIEGIVTFGYMGASPGVRNCALTMAYHLHSFLLMADLSAGYRARRKGMYCCVKNSINCRTMNLGRYMRHG